MLSPFQKVLPGPRPRLRDLGQLVPIFKRGMLDAYLGWAREADWHDFIVWAGPVPHLVVARIRTVRRVLAEKETFVRHGGPTGNLFGNGLLRMHGPPWRKRRNLLAPPFHPASVEAAVPIIREEVDALTSAWEKRVGTPFSPVHDVSFVMLRILGRFLFGTSFSKEAHGGRPLHDSLIALSMDSVFRHLLPSLAVEVFHGKKVRAGRSWLDGLSREVLGNGGETPFLEVLRGAISRGELDEQTAIDEIRTFLIAGHETSASALDWTLALLATHPEIQEQAREEAKAGGELPLIHRVIRESMRLYPPVPISIHVTTRETELDGLRLPAGTRVDLCSYLIHRNTHAWSDPERFDPDRFLDESSHSPYQFIPFLIGPHTCLGMRLAMTELPMAVAGILSKFRLKAPLGPPLVNLRISLHPAKFRLLLESL